MGNVIPVWLVEGEDPTPDGYHDVLLYEGESWWSAFRAIRAAKRNDMVVHVSWYPRSARHS